MVSAAHNERRARHGVPTDAPAFVNVAVPVTDHRQQCADDAEVTADAGPGEVWNARGVVQTQDVREPSHAKRPYSFETSTMLAMASMPASFGCSRELVLYIPASDVPFARAKSKSATPSAPDAPDRTHAL